jgi:hypothetical protein
MRQNIDSIVFAPPAMAGGVKSLYSVCGWLKEVGRSTIVPFDGLELASWFDHDCEAYDYAYSPAVLIYPEVFQPHISGKKYHICFALGKHRPIESHANLIVCRSQDVMDWLREQQPNIPATLIMPSINRAVFEYDGRPKEDIICYITRPDKHPETALLLRDRYGDKVREIANSSESAVAEALKSAKVFVWRGHDKEGSPRPPKEGIVAGCVVVGLESDLTEKHHIDLGIKCSTVEELVEMAGEALRMPIPTSDERSVLRDNKEEKEDWLTLLAQPDIADRIELTARSAPKCRPASFPTIEQMLTEQLTAREQVVQSLSAQLAEHHEKLISLTAQVESLTAGSAEKEETIRLLSAKVAGRESETKALLAKLTTREAELKRIAGSLGWRLLSLYGRIKYPYLLPIYRLLHLMPREPKTKD